MDGRSRSSALITRLALVPTVALVVMNPESYLALVEDQDTPLLLEALERAGASAEAISWHDQEADWARFDLVVLRTPWDYSQHPAAFEAWLGRTAAVTTVLNQPDLVRWNMDKLYLEQLAGAGITVVPTTYHRDEHSLRAALSEHTHDQGATSHATAPHVVLKPTVSAGSRHTGLFAADDPAALELGREILASGRTVMLQPEVTELSEGLEKALYVIDGHFTHAIAKGALLARGGGLRGGGYQERPQVVEAGAGERGFAEQVLSAASEVTGLQIPLYARIDVVDSAEHGLVLLEAELIEPSLNLPSAPEVADVLAGAILARITPDLNPPQGEEQT